ncbi:MAG TPA: ATP-binding protein [Chloroflexota bacterium]|jgi:excisionase family DNA binding protein|nr:ATP-binding protein [Chloroflexota bacterium]
MQTADASYYSISQVASLLGVSRVSVWRWISSGQLPATRLGHRTVRILRAHVDQLLANPPGPGGRRGPGLRTVSGDQTAPRAEWLKSGSPEHLVLFYDAERFLIDSVADFVAPSLNAGERAVLVATPDHRAAIGQQLTAAGIDVEAARAEARLIELDAQETLERFMVDDRPDHPRFATVVAEIVSTRHPPAAAGGTRIFGEMVALLVAQGNPQAAIALESLWGRAQQQYPFALLCAYPMAQLGSHGLAGLLSDVCAEHSTVVPTERYSSLEGSDDRLREIVALQQKAASLEHALTAERAARDQVEAALHAREEFLSIASHELRTPIAVLSAQAQLAMRRLARDGELDANRIAQAFKTMDAQAEKLSRLVSQLLDVTRLEAGKLDLDLRVTDLVRLVAQAASTHRALSERHSIVFEATASLDWVVDALRVDQLVSNLLDNAIKYSPDGGTIEVVLTQPTPTNVMLSIRDHGLGIPESKRSHIFDRFYQAHGTTYRSGMGLGLYVCRHIVELHGGAISAEFPADGGTRIVVELKK